MLCILNKCAVCMRDTEEMQNVRQEPHWNWKFITFPRKNVSTYLFIFSVFKSHFFWLMLFNIYIFVVHQHNQHNTQDRRQVTSKKTSWTAFSDFGLKIEIKKNKINMFGNKNKSIIFSFWDLNSEPSPTQIFFHPASQLRTGTWEELF